MYLLDEKGQVIAAMVNPIQWDAYNGYVERVNREASARNLCHVVGESDEVVEYLQTDCFHGLINRSVSVPTLSDFSCDGPTYPYLKIHGKPVKAKDGWRIHSTSMAHKRLVLNGYIATGFGGANLYDLFLNIDTPFSHFDFRFGRSSSKIPSNISTPEAYRLWFDKEKQIQRKLNIEQGKTEFKKVLELIDEIKNSPTDEKLEEVERRLRESWPSFAGFVFDFLRYATFAEYNCIQNPTSQKIADAQDNQTVLNLAYRISDLFCKENGKVTGKAKRLHKEV